MKDRTSKRSRRCRRVIAKPPREPMVLHPGDVLHFQVTAEGTVIVKENPTANGEGAFAVFSEWNSVEDDQLYRSL